MQFLVWFCCAFLVAVSSAAAESPEVQPEDEAVVETTLIAEIDRNITVSLDGKPVKGTQVMRSKDGALLINAAPMFAALQNAVEFDEQTKALIVRRSQDGVVMELYTDTGIVKANGKPLGRLKSFGVVSADRYILTPNAVSVLSGTNGTFNEETDELQFKLDPRLRVATGFDIFVNGISLGNVSPEPKAVGPVLLLPLRPVAEALGHDVSLFDGGNSVRVRRAQDSVVFKLDLTTGLVKVDDRPYGITKDVTYIDAEKLLLPVSAIETLTGTHITTQGGTDRVDIDLDERLSGAVTPTASVDETTRNAPFTPESLAFHVGLDTINTVEADFHIQRINGRIRYETPDLPTQGEEFQPSWLSLDFAHTSGVRGSIGDYSADYRELDGVGQRRIRGIAAAKDGEFGRWSLAIGAPADGAKTISDDQSRLTFGGLAAGARFASQKGYEVGLAAKFDSDADDTMIVASALSGALGRSKDAKVQWDAAADIGIFDGPARQDGVDLRGRAAMSYKLSPVWSLDAFTQYDGAEFLRNDLDAEDLDEDILDITDPETAVEDTESLLPDTRRRGSDQLTNGLSVRAVPRENIGFLTSPAVSMGVQRDQSGFARGDDMDRTLNKINGSAAASIAQTGVSVSLDASFYEFDAQNNAFDETGRQFSARAYKQFDLGTLRAQLSHNKRGNETLDVATVTAISKPYNLPLPKDAVMSAAPSATALYSSDDKALRGGLIANFNSGQLLGAKTRIDASLGVLQSVSQRADSRTDKYLTVSVARKVRLGKNMALGLSYRNNLDGDQQLGVQLDGRFEFNERRRYTKTKKGRGVLKGRAFVDLNRDGIAQPDEIGARGVVVRVKNTRLALRTDANGYFTIQNIKEGLYDVSIDARDLPLGFALAETAQTRATIQDGQITDLALPIVQRGQIRGFAFNDSNGDGEYQSGETRVEGTKLILVSKDTGEEITAWSTSFGQYAFDDLEAGDYVLQPAGNGDAASGSKIVIDLGQAENLMAKVNMALPVKADEKRRKELRAPSPKDTMALALKEPTAP